MKIDCKGFTLAELSVTIALVFLIGVIIYSFSQKDKPDTSNYTCKDKLISCKYECADSAFPSNLDDCLRRCDIKLEYCSLNK